MAATVYQTGIGSRHPFFTTQVDAARTAVVAFVMAAVMVGVLIWLSASALTFQDDAAQYLSTAQHILAGDGVRTSVLYYDHQLAQTAPAAQTVWPAGLPALTALVAGVTGLSLDRALLLIGILAHVGTAACLAVVFRQWRMSAWISLGAAGLWLMNVGAWLSVSRGLADPLYQFFAALIVVGLAGFFTCRSRSLLWLSLVAMALAAAVLARYQAVALIPALALALTVAGRSRASWRRRLLIVAAGTAPAVALLMMLFARNWSLTGSLSGGAQASAGQSFMEVAQRISWVPEAIQPVFLALLVASCALSTLLAVTLWARGSLPLRTHSPVFPAPVRAASVYCLGAYAGNIGLLLLLCLTSTAYSIEMRYLIVCLMFLLIPAIWFAARWLRLRSAAGHEWRVSVGLGSAMALVTLAQLVILQQPYLERLETANPTRLRQILLANPGSNESALAMLRRLGQEQQVLMSTHAHSLSLLTDTTIVGVPVPAYTNQTWDETQIRDLAERHGVKYVVAFRGMKTWVYRDLINKMLDVNQCPAWLEPVVARPDLFIARVSVPSAAVPGASSCSWSLKPTKSAQKTTSSVS